jgi:hypothetical protein
MSEKKPTSVRQRAVVATDIDSADADRDNGAAIQD